jgi:hypothetical protein
MSNILPFGRNNADQNAGYVEASPESAEVSTGNALLDGIRQRLKLRDDETYRRHMGVASQDPSVMDITDVPYSMRQNYPVIPMPSAIVERPETSRSPDYNMPTYEVPDAA